MQVNTDSVAILTKQVLKSEVEVLKSRLDDEKSHCHSCAGRMVLFMCCKIGLKNWKERVYDNKQSR